MSHRKYCFKIFENIYSSGIFSLFLWKRVWQLGGWGWKVNTDTLRPNKYWSQKLLKVLNAWTDHIPSEVKDNFVSICHWRLRDSILHLSPSLPVQAEGRKQGVTNYCQWVKTKVSLHRYLFSIQVNSPVCEAMMQPGMYDKSVTHTKNCWLALLACLDSQLQKVKSHDTMLLQTTSFIYSKFHTWLPYLHWQNSSLPITSHLRHINKTWAYI